MPTPEQAADRIRELAKLLADLFKVEELRRWIRFTAAPALAHDLPGDPISVNKFCFELVELLSHHGTIDAAFFAKLRAARPKREQDINAVAKQWQHELSQQLQPQIEEYREALARQLDAFPFLSVLTSDLADGNLNITLHDLFVPPQVTESVPPGDKNPSRERNPREQESRTPTPARGLPQPVEDVVGADGTEWLVILGAPGSGKTSLGQWLALRLCRADTTSPALKLPTELVPVCIDLRQFARGHGDFFDYLDTHHREHSLPLRKTALQHLAETKQLLWLFDGLDEVDASVRTDIAQKILGLKRAYGGYGVITGRIVGSEDARRLLANGEIPAYTLWDFDDARVDQFLERWHNVVYADDTATGARARDRLREAVRSTPAIYELSHNPLLLTLIARLGHSDLPRRRHELLDRAAELLLERWDLARGLPRSIRFSLAIKRRFLAGLAWHMALDVPGGFGNILDQEHLLRFTEKFCQETFPGDEDSATTTARDLIRVLRSRNTIFGAIGGNAFGFLHKAFFEFFLAEAIFKQIQACDDEQLGVFFAAGWHGSPWRETLLLLCGRMHLTPARVIVALQAVLASLSPLNRHWQSCLLPFVIAGLAAGCDLTTGRSREFAAQLQGLVWATIGDAASTDDASHLRLFQAFHHTARTWPSTAAVCQQILQAPRHLRHSRYKPHTARNPARLRNHGLLVASAVLPDDERDAQWVRWVQDGAVDIVFFADAIHQTWPQTFWGRLRTTVLANTLPPHEALPLLISWIHCHFHSDHGDEHEPPAAELAPVLARILATDTHAIVTQGKGETKPYQWLPALCCELLRQRPEYSGDNEVVGHFALDRHNLDLPARTEILLDALAEHPEAQACHHIGHYSNTFKSVRLLELFLAAQDDPPEVVVERITDCICFWPEGVAHLVAWGQARGVDEARLEFIEALLPLKRDPLAQLTDAEVTAATAAILDVLRPRPHDPSTPNWLIVDELNQLIWRPLPPTAKRECLTQLQQRYPNHALDLGLTLGKTFAFKDDSFTPVYKAWCNQAATEQPLLAILFGRFFEEYTPRLPDLLCRALAQPVSPRNLKRLLDFAQTSLATRQDLALVHTIFRYVYDHSTDLGDRLTAARRLEDEAAVRQLAPFASQNPDIETALALLDARDRIVALDRPRRAIVRLAGRPVGRLFERTLEGDTCFIYDPEYLAAPDARPVAPTMPLRPEPYESRGLHPVFANLLPEGWLLDIDLRKYNLKPSDAFGLLLATGHDTIGAIEVHQQ